mgnify:CR=1 FL=1
MFITLISSTVFNDDGTTADFRVESTSNTHMLFVDGGLDRVGIGENAPDTILHVKGTGPGGQGTIKIEGESAHLGFTKSDGNFRSWIGQYNSSNHGSDSDLNIKTGYVGGSSSTGNIRISANGDTTAAQVYLQGSTGNFGIGTTSPGSSLSVAANTSHSNNRITIFSDDYNYGQIRIGSSTTEASLGFMRSTTQANTDSNGPSGGNNLWAMGLGVWGANFGIGSNSLLAYAVEWDSSGHMLPGANNTYDLGSTARGWRNIYTNDLNLSNMPSEGTDVEGNPYIREGNEVDGTNGSWTIQEGEDDLFLINRRNGRKYKFKLEEVS